MYDKQGLLLSSEMGLRQSEEDGDKALSLYLNDNHFDLITDVHKFKPYISRETVVMHCHKCHKQCQDQRKVLCDECGKCCRACLKEVDTLNEVGLCDKCRSFDNVTKKQRELVQKKLGVVISLTNLQE